MEEKVNLRQRIKEEGIQLKREVLQTVFGHVVTALGLVAALAWNDAIQTAIKEFFTFSNSTLLAKIYYAFGITLVVVIFTVYATRWFLKK